MLGNDIYCTLVINYIFEYSSNQINGNDHMCIESYNNTIINIEQTTDTSLIKNSTKSKSAHQNRKDSAKYVSVKYMPHFI
jgi:hypothetical protein